MQTSSVRTLSPSTIKSILFVSLLFVSIYLPSLIHQQVIAGSLVNASLLLATAFLGSSSAIAIGLIPSVVALSRGLLPLVLAPMVPFIMLANMIYVLVYDRMSAKGHWLASLLAAFSKFGWLQLSSYFVLSLFLPNPVWASAKIMMSWPQLLTALVGSVIAGIILNKNLQQKSEQ
ncbi:MAG TPA: iron hydrogenase [Candidatus Woesebacteria bacterium]|nr:iron hydrogenase [Candidatus Woesebacteria bacterium]